MNREFRTLEESIAKATAGSDKPFNKYFWLPLHWYFLNPLIFNPIGWIKRLPSEIAFRLRNKCPSKDTFCLDDSFYDWVYPRLKVVINDSFKLNELDEETREDYKMLLELNEGMQYCDDILERQGIHEEFMRLFGKHLLGLWT